MKTAFIFHKSAAPRYSLEESRIKRNGREEHMMGLQGAMHG
jgi:hypothetical protein